MVKTVLYNTVHIFLRYPVYKRVHNKTHVLIRCTIYVIKYDFKFFSKKY